MHTPLLFLLLMLSCRKETENGVERMNEILKLVILMSISTVCKGVNGIGMKLAQRGYEPSLRRTLYYTWVYLTFQAIFQLFLPPYGPMHATPQQMILPALFGIFYVFNLIAMSYAFKEGPTSLTLVINSFNTMFPIFFGLIFWDETLKLTQIIGLVLFIAAVIVLNKSSYKSGEKGAQTKKLTPKWFGYTFLSFLFASFAVTCSKQYGLWYPGSIKEYLFGYSSITSLLLLPVVAYIFFKHRQDIIKQKELYIYSAMSAVAIDSSNVVFMLYVTSISSAFFFPLSSILSVFAAAVGSRLVLKEKISKNAIIGLIISAVALAILAL